MMMAELHLDDIRYANVVVMGKVVNYHIVKDQLFRQQHKEMLEHAPNKGSPEWAEDYAWVTSDKTRFLSDYARFDVQVDEVLAGKAPKVITVTWNNPTFGEPESMPEGPYLIGLRQRGSKIPPLRGPSATMGPAPEGASLTVLQAPCAPAFLLDASSAEAKTIRDLLAAPAKNQNHSHPKKGRP